MKNNRHWFCINFASINIKNCVEMKKINNICDDYCFTFDLFNHVDLMHMSMLIRIGKN